MAVDAPGQYESKTSNQKCCTIGSVWGWSQMMPTVGLLSRDWSKSLVTLEKRLYWNSAILVISYAEGNFKIEQISQRNLYHIMWQDDFFLQIISQIGGLRSYTDFPSKIMYFAPEKNWFDNYARWTTKIFQTCCWRMRSDIPNDTCLKGVLNWVQVVWGKTKTGKMGKGGRRNYAWGSIHPTTLPLYSSFTPHMTFPKCRLTPISKDYCMILLLLMLLLVKEYIYVIQVFGGK